MRSTEVLALRVIRCDGDGGCRVSTISVCLVGEFIGIEKDHYDSDSTVSLSASEAAEEALASPQHMRSTVPKRQRSRHCLPCAFQGEIAQRRVSAPGRTTLSGAMLQMALV
jgi:hypothetical protein